MIEVAKFAPWRAVAVVAISGRSERDPDEAALSKRLVFRSIEH